MNARGNVIPGDARPRRALLLVAVGASLLSASLLGCSGGGEESGRIRLSAWCHSGQEAERRTIVDQVARFNASQDEIEVELKVIPEGTYNDQVQAAAVSGDLPDVLEFDGPYLYNYVWQGNLVALDDLLPADVKEKLLPSIVKQGTYRDRLYSVGTFDSGLGLYGRRSQLEKVGARIPASPEDAWSIDEFEALLASLAEEDEDGQVLDLKLNYEGEWFTYGYSPILQSAGGDLIDRKTFQSADGVLNGEASVGAMRRLQNWITSGRVDPNVDDAAFTEGRVALSWSGHWDYRRYAQAAGDDLVVLPLPDFGQGTKTGQGSWNWGVTTRCEHPHAAAQFFEFLLQTEEVLKMADANGAPPGTKPAIEASELYGDDGPLHLFAEQLTGGFAVPRPRTPAYPIITSAFQEAFVDIRDGGDVQAALDRAVKVIDDDIRENEGYPAVQ
jgi:multiple sugar transport system substrate-binding protein